MLKALFRKQFLEFLSRMSRRNGKPGGKGKKILFAILYVYAFGALIFMFAGLSALLCGPLTEAGQDWLYFAMMAMMATAFGVIGSVFSAYSALYRSKDNELLLSMPIPPSALLFVRLSGVALLGLLFSAMVYLPAATVYQVTVGFKPIALVCALLELLVIGCIVTALTCLLGWIIALISGHVRNKTAVTLIVSLAFIGAYFYVYSSAYSFLPRLLENTDGISSAVRSWLFPYYVIGQGSAGALPWLLVSVLIGAVILFLTHWILSRTYLRLITANSGRVKRSVYREKSVRAGSAFSAMLFKEFKRFTASAGYMLNCGLGIFMMIILAAAALIKTGTVRSVIAQIAEEAPSVMSLLPLFVAGMLCLFSGTVDITAPSVSLEGKTVWIPQSLPVPPVTALRAKLALHLFMAVPPILITAAALSFVLKFSPVEIVLILLLSLSFTCLIAEIGLALNLLMPNLNWMNENIPVKQSAPVFLTLFGSWVTVILFGFLYMPLSAFLTPTVYMLLLSALFTLLSLLLYAWIGRGGAKRYAVL